MKLLHCVPTLLDGGAERQLAYLSAALASRGWDVGVAYQVEGPLRARLERAGVRLHRLRRAFPGDPRTVLDLARTVAATAPDVVQSWLPVMDLAVGVLARLRPLRWVLSERASRLAYAGATGRLRRWAAGRASVVVANSAEGASYWAAGQVRRIPRRVIPNGLPIEEIDAAAPAPSEGGRRILFVGRLVPQKNVLTLVRALARLAGEGTVATAVFIGAGPMAEAARAEADRAGLSGRCRFLGARTDVWSWMKASDALAAPSLFEGHPNVVLEAMACGCPVVASDIPEHREFLDAGTSMLVPARDEAALAQALRRVLEEPDEARGRAAAARAKARSLSVERMADRYAEAYREIAATSRNR
jgi:glycosyltransferase involved in cell wall biosynthesis